MQPRPLPPATVPAARVDFTPEDRQWIADRIQEVLASGQLTLGKFGAEFETRFARLCGAPHAIAVGSGTAALEIILRCLDVGGGDVLVPANTFFATAAAVIHAGARPVFMDTDPATFGTAPAEIERRLTANTAAVVVVHIGGIVSPRMPEIREVTHRRGIALVEDAAHAHGASFDGTAAGAFGIAGAFSFYPTKVMTAAEGGMIVTGDDRLAAASRAYRDQGKASFERNEHTHLGYNWRLSEPHAIIGLRHLEHLPDMVAARRHIAAAYDDGLRGVERLRPLRVPAGSLSNYYKYIALIDPGVDRAALKARIRAEFGVGLAGEVYETPLHRQPVFAAYAQSALPVADDICARHVCLPVFASMSAAQAEQVIDAIRRTCG